MPIPPASAPPAKRPQTRLARGLTIIEGEDPAVFAKLIADLRDEHRPDTSTEVRQNGRRA